MTNQRLSNYNIPTDTLVRVHFQFGNFTEGLDCYQSEWLNDLRDHKINVIDDYTLQGLWGDIITVVEKHCCEDDGLIDMGTISFSKPILLTYKVMVHYWDLHGELIMEHEEKWKAFNTEQAYHIIDNKYINGMLYFYDDCYGLCYISFSDMEVEDAVL